MAGPAALLFDLDGTMLNTDHIHRQIFADMMRPHGLDITETFYNAHIHGRLNEDFFAEFLPELPDPKGLSDAKEAEFRNRLPQPYPAMPGVVDLVRQAQDIGWALAVVTNAQRANAEAMLNAIGVRDAFDVIIIGEECELGKPHPMPYLMAMDQLGVTAERAIAFEDSPSGLRSACASGAYTVGVRSTLSDADMRAEGAQTSITDFTDPALPQILANFAR